MANKLKRVADGFKSKPTNFGVSDALASLFTDSEKKTRRRRKPKTALKLPERRKKIPQGIPLWRADKLKSEAKRLFAKGIITKQEARKRVVQAESDFNVFMQRIKGIDVSSGVARQKGEDNGKLAAL